MDQRIKNEQLTLLFAGLPSSLVATVVMLALAIGMTDTNNALLACAALLVVSALRLTMWFAYQRYSRRENIAWSDLFFVGCTAAGAAWGATVVILFPHGDVSGQAFLSFLIAGVSAGGVTALAADRRNVLGFVLPCVLPLSIRLYVEAGDYGVTMSIMVFVYTLVICAAGFRLHQQIHDNIVLRLEASELQRVQQRSERALATAYRQLQDFINAADHVAIIAVDNNGIVTMLNRGAEKMLGYAASELAGKLTLELLMDADEVQQLAESLSTPTRRRFGLHALLEHTREHGSLRRQCLLVGKQDQRLHVDLVLSTMRGDDNNVNGFLATAVDVSERLRAAEALSRMNERFQLATHSAGMGVWDWDVAADVLVWDPRAYEIYGAPSDLTPSMAYLLRILHPEDVDRARAEFIGALSGKSKELRTTFRIIRPSGEERVISSSGLTLRSPNGRAVRMTGLIWDVTETQRVERMKNEFVATVSHELRTPLTSIRGSLGLVAAGAAGKLPERALSLVNMALNNCERLTHLINDILDMEKLESDRQRFDVRRMNLAELVTRSLEDNAGFAQSIGVRFVVPEPLCDVDVLVDSGRFLQVMANLLSNAGKFSPSGAPIEIRASAAQGRVRVSVRDFGKGIPAEFQPRLFQKFSQADSSDSRRLAGTGLGLAISRAIVERLGGNIGFETGPGGTTFYFDLPDADSIAAATEALSQSKVS